MLPVLRDREGKRRIMYHFNMFKYLDMKYSNYEQDLLSVNYVEETC